MDFDLSAARRDFSDEKILQGLKSRGMLSFDVDAALKDGFAATEILDTIYKPPVEQPKPEPSSLLRRAGDVGISLARGVIGLPEALVGVADIPTLGLAGKGLQAARVDFKGAKDFLSEFYSPEQAAANKAVSDAKGFKGTIAASLENPSTILSAAAESLPQMLGGAAAARKIGATALGSGLSAITRGAAGEGIIAAGASAEGIRQQTEDGLLTPFQSGAAATSGALTGLIGVVGGRVANKLGIEDLDTLLAGSRKGVTTQGIAKRIIGGGISEGVFEELPQSAQEQIFQNAALDKPLLQGVEESAAKGLLVGAAMGGASNIRGSRTQTTPEAPPAPGEDAAAQEDASAETSPAPLLLENREDPLLSFPDGSVGRQSDFDAFIESLPENERIPQRARLMGLGEQASDPVPTVDDIIQSPDIDTAIESASAIIDRPTPAETEKKNSDVDMAWQEFNASKSAQREAEFAAAEQQRQIAQEQQIIDEVANQNVERANILTQAEGFDNPGQNAMQAAFERARQNRDTRPLSSITGGVAVSGFQVADLDASIRPLKMKWQGFSNVRTVQSVADIPPDIAARLNADAQTEGFYDPKTQSVYLIADAISTPERAAFVAAHEVIGHGGLRLLQDKTVTQAVQFASGNRFIKELAKAIGQERGSGQQNINTEEAIAELAAALETGDLTGIESRYGVKIPEASKKTLSGAVSRVIESVKRWFAGVMGIPIEQVSNREIYALISSQMAAVSGMSSSGTANPNYQGLIQQSRKEKGKSLSTEEIMELIDSGKDIFVRWSGGKKYDNKPSRDYVSGNTEAGLSAVKLENWDKTTLNSRLGEYVFQRLSDETRMPWIIEGKQNGVDSDGYPTIEVNSAKYLGFWNEKTGKPEGAPEFVKNQYGNLVRYMEMAEDLAENKLIMNRITNPIARQITQSAIDFQERALKFDPPSAKPMQSRAPKSVNKIEVDGVERSTVNSKGQPIAQTPEAMRNFWRWFGDSKAVDKQGRPLAMYHGTVNDVDSFQKGQADAIFVTLDPNYANQFATRGLGSDQSMWGQIMEEDDLRPNIMEVYAKADNPFDYENRENVDAFVKMRGDMFLEEIAITDDPKRNKLIEETYRDLAARIGNSVANGDWDYIERDDVQSAIRALGHDGFYVEENDLTGVITKNLAVFSSNQIKSATGNAGTFDPASPSILQSRAPKLAQKIMVDGVERSTMNSKGQPIAQTPEAMKNFWRWFGDSKVVDEQGRPQVVYHGSYSDIYEFDPTNAGYSGKSVLKNGIEFTDDSEVADFYAGSSADYSDEYDVGANYPSYIKIKNPFVLTKKIHKGDYNKSHKFANEINLYLNENDEIENSKSYGSDYLNKNELDILFDFIEKNGIPDGVFIQSANWDSSFTGENNQFIVFESNQIKSATGNAGTFDPNRSSILQSRAPTTERIPKWAEGYSERDKETLRKAGAIYTEQTFKDKLAEMREGMGAKLVQGVLDQYAPIKSRLGDVPYMLARMSKASDQGLEAMMNYGRLFLDGGAIDVDTSKPGLVEVLAKLNGEHEQFFQWLAGNRAKQLKAQGRENLLSDSDITFLSNLNQGQMKDGSSRAQAYTTAQLQVAALNNSVLDIAEESGIIDKESRKTWASEFYVPFYRVIEEGVAGPTVKGGLINQQSIKRLKGGTNNLADLMGNMQKNWATLLAASAKNRAAASILPKAAVIGAATEVPESTARNMAKSASAKVASFMDEGVKRFYVMEDDALFTAISALEFNGYNNAAMRVMGGFKNLLTKLVTAAPGFKFFRNPVRDAISSIAVSNKLGWNPISNFKQGVTLLRDDDFRASMIAGGGMMRFGTYLDGNRADYLKGILNANLEDQTMLNTPEKIKNFFGMLWDKYNAVGDYGENFNRAALYGKLRKEGKSHLEASFEARDLMDFGLSGAWLGVRALNQVLPFFNARLQGLYKLGRGYNDDPKRVWTVIATLSIASIAMMLAYKDDEDWKKRTDQDKISNWWFKFGGAAYRIPKPFEVGAAASAIENFTALWLDSENTNAKRFASQLGDIAHGQLAMNFMPQMVRPMIDVYANKDSFTGRSIESLAMQRLRPEDRYTYNTSEIARLISQAGLLFDPISFVSGTGYKQLSPVQIDAVIKGYFTSVGVLVTAATDGLLRSTVIDRGERLPVTLRTKSFGIAEELPANQSRYIDILYDAAVKIDRSYASYKEAIKIGDIEKAREIAEANPNLEGKYHFISKVKDAESKLGSQIKLIMNNKRMTGEEKEAKIRQIKQRQNDIAQRVADKIR